MGKKILITGANSYIGTSVEEWLGKYPEWYEIETIDMVDNTWRRKDFSGYHVIFHVAGIAHKKVKDTSSRMWDKYYNVNTQLAFETARKAKEAGVGQFIFMSSMSIYGNVEHITFDTIPCPQSFYGDSKWRAEQKLAELSDAAFRIAILRPPMVFGKGAKGNYPILSKLSKKTIIFPKVENRRSMIYIENLCEFIRLIIDNNEAVVFFPQDENWINTTDMVRKIATVSNHRIWFTKILVPCIHLGNMLPGKIGTMCKKAFGSCYYDLEMSDYKGRYRLYDLETAIERTERQL